MAIIKVIEEEAKITYLENVLFADLTNIGFKQYKKV